MHCDGHRNQGLKLVQHHPVRCGISCRASCAGRLIQLQQPSSNCAQCLQGPRQTLAGGRTAAKRQDAVAHNVCQSLQLKKTSADGGAGALCIARRSVAEACGEAAGHLGHPGADSVQLAVRQESGGGLGGR